MPDSSPPTSRVVDVMELVASRPANSLRAADLARDLGIAKGTIHAIVHSLCERGWLMRAPGATTLQIGPGFVPVASAVHNQRTASSRALEAARKLASSTGLTTSVVDLVGQTMYVASIDPADPRGRVLAQQIAYAAPFGSLFAAWAPSDERTEWLRRGLVTGPAAASYQEFLDRARGDGVLVEWMSPVIEHVVPLLQASEDGSVSEDLRTLVRAVVDEVVRTQISRPKNPSGPHPVTSVAAPIVADGGQVTTALVIHPLTVIGTRDLHRIKALVRNAANAVSPLAARSD